LLIQWGNSFEFLNWIFSSQEFWKNSSTRYLLSAERWNPQNVLHEAFQAQRGYSEHHRLRMSEPYPLGSRPRQGSWKVAGQEGDPRITSHAPESAKSVREWTLTLPNELPCWELESQMDSRMLWA
jgi:hypothetical protein